MATPTISSRLERRLILMADDAATVQRLREALPDRWEMAVAAELAAVGGFAELLLHRFMLVDLDATAFDPVGVIRAVRGEFMLNLAIFCFGGDRGLRDAARLARVDRCFTREEIGQMLPALCEQFGWGG
jgi:hypothetical protein